MAKINSIIIILFLFAFTSCADSLSGNNEEESVLFEKIKVGMRKSEVEMIIGKPDYMNPSSDRDCYYYYFTKNKSRMRSEMPLVLFDSTGVVKFSTYGEGG